MLHRLNHVLIAKAIQPWQGEDDRRDHPGLLALPKLLRHVGPGDVELSEGRLGDHVQRDGVEEHVHVANERHGAAASSVCRRRAAVGGWSYRLQ